MSSNQQNISKHFLAIVVVFQVILYLAMFLNLSTVRIVIGAAYLTLIPGLIITKLLKLDNLGTAESIIYTVGFSIAFLMIAGLVINQFGYLAGLNSPLAALPLYLFINTLVLIGAAATHFLRNRPQNNNNDTIGQYVKPISIALGVTAGFKHCRCLFCKCYWQQHGFADNNLSHSRCIYL